MVLRFGASAALLGLLAARLDWAALGRHLTAPGWRWFAPVAVLSPACLVLLTARWIVFLRAQGLRPPFGGVLRLLWSGQFLNTFLPGAVGGDIYKAVAIGRLFPQTSWAAGTTVVLDRFCALLTLLLLAAAGLWSQRGWVAEIMAGGMTLRSGWGVALLAGILGVGAVGLWLWRSDRARVLWTGRGRQVWQALMDGGRDVRTLAVASALSLVIHLANFGVFFALGRALRLNLQFGQVLLVMPAVLFASMLPVSINGHGIRELLLVGYFSWQGIGASGGLEPASAAVAVSLLYVANDLLWNLPGGLWLAWSKSIAAPSARAP